MTGTDVATYARERPGLSAFVLEDGIVYHSYSTYARGLDGLWGAYQWLDPHPRAQRDRLLVASPRRIRQGLRRSSLLVALPPRTRRTPSCRRQALSSGRLPQRRRG